MNYVESFNLFGVEAMQIPCITGVGAPTIHIAGVPGCFYMDKSNGTIYKCVADPNGGYIWKKETKIDDNKIGADTWSSQKIVDHISHAISQAGIIQATVE